MAFLCVLRELCGETGWSAAGTPVWREDFAHDVRWFMTLREWIAKPHRRFEQNREIGLEGRQLILSRAGGKECHDIGNVWRIGNRTPIVMGEDATET